MTCKGEAVSLEEMLIAKEKRVAYYSYLIKKHQGIIVSYKLNIPGPIKSNKLILEIFHEGLHALFTELRKGDLLAITEKFYYQKTGPEYIAIFKGDPSCMKGLTTAIEETHSLGRLFDFDVIDENMKQYSRIQIGREPRKCFVCEKDAFQCGRARAHDLNTLLKGINEMVESYFSKKDVL